MAAKDRIDHGVQGWTEEGSLLDLHIIMMVQSLTIKVVIENGRSIYQEAKSFSRFELPVYACLKDNINCVAFFLTVLLRSFHSTCHEPKIT